MFSENLLIGISAALASWFLYRSIKSNRLEKPLIIFLSILFIYQFKTTNLRPLTHLNEQEKITQLRRLREYPPLKISFGTKTVWIPLAHWLEERPEMLVIYRIQKNLGEVVNPNLYFFANHPNERVGIKEHEKFPYILLPFFVVGFLGLNFRKNITALSSSLFAPILLVGLIGSQIDTEPISLFPFITVSCARGIEYAKKKVTRLKSKNIKKIIIILFIAVYFLILLQTALYDRF